jgi:SAM-dependent methyltransferase
MSIANHEQAEHWNRDEAYHWVTHQVRYDQMLEPLADMLLEAAALAAGDRVLDVGCGCGATTLAAARVVAAAPVVGVDLSAPMLAQARADADRAGIANTRFEQADAQVHPFDEGAFDTAISRFGMMFFADPTAAFANLHRSTRPGGRLVFVCWQELAANEWLLVPGTALAQHVALPDLGPPGAPGMFALADPERTRTLLAQAGWRDIDITARRAPILVGGRGSLDDATEFLRTGSIGRTVLHDADADTEGRAIAAVRDALAPYVTDDGVQLDAAVWLVTAR